MKVATKKTSLLLALALILSPGLFAQNYEHEEQDSYYTTALKVMSAGGAAVAAIYYFCVYGAQGAPKKHIDTDTESSHDEEDFGKPDKKPARQLPKGSYFSTGSSSLGECFEFPRPHSAPAVTLGEKEEEEEAFSSSDGLVNSVLVLETTPTEKSEEPAKEAPKRSSTVLKLKQAHKKRSEQAALKRDQRQRERKNRTAQRQQAKEKKAREKAAKKEAKKREQEEARRVALGALKEATGLLQELRNQ